MGKSFNVIVTNVIHGRGGRMDRRLFVRIRKLGGFNQEQYARRIGISRALVAAIEVGNRRIMPYVMEKVTAEFGAGYVRKVRELAEELAAVK